jgi:hypothetical protein
MAGEELTITLEGDIPLHDFARAMHHFHELIAALTEVVAAGADITWMMQDLEVGSARATVRGEAADLESVARVKRAYAAVGHALRSNEPIPYPSKVAKPARAIVSVINEKVLAVTFSAGDEDIVIEARRPEAGIRETVALGAIEGRVQTLSERKRPHFTLFDAIHDQAVSCYMPRERLGEALQFFGRLVQVRGTVFRYAATGRPIKVDPVVRVEVLDEREPGDYRRARGIAPVPPDSLSTVEAMRRVRDA